MQQSARELLGATGGHDDHPGADQKLPVAAAWNSVPPVRLDPVESASLSVTRSR